MRCHWCDSTYSFYQGDWQSVAQVLATVEQIGCPMVEVTGGEPLLQPGALPLMTALCDRGFEVLLETGGGVDIAAVDPRVRRIVDVKCPGSGEEGAMFWPNLEQLSERDEVKFVLADRRDYDWAKGVLERYGLERVCTVHFSPVVPKAPAQGSSSQREETAAESPRGLPAPELAAWILEDRLGVRLQLQIHKFLWGDARGV
jgi:7-carboxy-7-deazaguanine synthase